MNAKELGEQPAMPTAAFDGPNDHYEWPTYGMTKREAFAMAAMQGLCAALADYDAREMLCDNANANGHHPKAQVARAAVNYADALLAELAKEPT